MPGHRRHQVFRLARIAVAQDHQPVRRHWRGQHRSAPTKGHRWPTSMAAVSASRWIPASRASSVLPAADDARGDRRRHRLSRAHQVQSLRQLHRRTRVKITTDCAGQDTVTAAFATFRRACLRLLIRASSATSSAVRPPGSERTAADAPAGLPGIGRDPAPPRPRPAASVGIASQSPVVARIVGPA